MVKSDCSYSLMKAISCYVHKDERVWYYIYETAVTYIGSNPAPSFWNTYKCDLINALNGREHVLEPYDWIAQMLLWCKLGLGKRLFGTAIYGEKTELSIRYKLD